MALSRPPGIVGIEPFPSGPPRCDFCTDLSPTIATWEYDAEPFQVLVGVPGAPTINFEDTWWACDVCHGFIERDDWRGLARRNEAGWFEKKIWAGFRRHRQGTPRPVVTVRPFWKEQWHRVQRHLDRFEAVATLTNVGTEDALDLAYGFFQNCYHLKDWLKNDESVPTRTGRAVEGFIGQDDALSICADLANATKHLRIDPTRHRPRRDEHTRVARADVTVYVGRGLAHRFTVASLDEEYDALDLAKRCVAAWAKWLRGQGLS